MNNRKEITMEQLTDFIEKNTIPAELQKRGYTIEDFIEIKLLMSSIQEQVTLEKELQVRFKKNHENMLENARRLGELSSK
ncbi:hypothetical protein [Bacillus sp. FJAT-45037]|uniref:hypothetical protein n=1 Tax=Bacillus sp. FJAT-45037 TaxID=2011007 RepID=UPI000C2426A7|nr:hypothetical protein [Bacillus sp. FJAT-45037]